MSSLLKFPRVCALLLSPHSSVNGHVAALHHSSDYGLWMENLSSTSLIDRSRLRHDAFFLSNTQNKCNLPQELKFDQILAVGHISAPGLNTQPSHQGIVYSYKIENKAKSAWPH